MYAMIYSSLFVVTSSTFIDISLLLSSNASVKDKLLCSLSIDHALRTDGYFVTTVFNISNVVLPLALEAADDLFSQDAKAKSNYSIKHLKSTGRGYLPFGSESGVSSYYELKEGFSYGHPLNNQQQREKQHHPLQQSNIWPENLKQESIKTLEELFLAKSILANTILTSLHDAIQYEQKYQQKPLKMEELHQQQIITTEASSSFNPHFLNTELAGGDRISLMRMFHYFTSSVSPSQNQSSSSSAVSIEKETAVTITTDGNTQETFTSSSNNNQHLTTKDLKLNNNNNNNSNNNNNHNSITNEQTVVLGTAVPTTKDSKSHNITNNNNKTVIGSSPHTDWGLLTVITYNGVDGLEFFNRKSNQWEALPYTISGGIVINAGDYLQLLSQYRYHSPVHRVVLSHASTAAVSSSTANGAELIEKVNETSSVVDINTDINNNTTTHTTANDKVTIITPAFTTTNRISFVYFHYPRYDSIIPIAGTAATNRQQDLLHSLPSTSQTCDNKRKCDEDKNSPNHQNHNIIQHNYDHFEYNTLLQLEDQNTDDKIADHGSSAAADNESINDDGNNNSNSNKPKLLFGDYILEKWQGVYR